ncbi:MAG: hypothetical protein ACTHOC_09160 [Luteimonas sp.]
MDVSTGKIRSVGAMAGFRWLWDAINIGRRGALAVFGGAGLLLLVGMVAMIALAIVGIGGIAAFGASTAATLALWFVFMVPLLLLFAFGLVGYMRLIDAVESGRTARATDALRGFADVGAGLDAFLVLLAVVVVQQALMIGIIAAWAPEVGGWYLSSLHGAATGAQHPVPPGFWKVYLVNMVFGTVGNGLQAVAVGQVALRGRGIAAALREGALGVLRNLPALFMLVLSGIALVTVLAVLVVAAVMLLMAVGKLFALWLAAIVGAILYLALLVATIAVGGAAMYYMWRDIAGPGEAPAAVAA